ncbi:MAG: hypothetical protein WD716_03955 [Fimbriimonadaceae bacterium]
MKQTVSDRIRPLLLTATLFLSLTTAAQTTTSVEIKSVDNYAGNSNVTTNAPNATVTVTELDADKKPVRSWTGTTDAEGKITVPAGSNLSKPFLRATKADPKMAEFVLPPDLRINEPFMFAATGVVEGEVVSVQTVEGEVVATKKADKFGRVFLAAGLASGSYLITSTRHNATKVGTVNVSKVKFDVADVKGLLSLDNDTGAIDFTKWGVIDGNFPNPDLLELDDFESRRSLNVLAASTRTLLFDKPADLGIKPGTYTVTVEDTASHTRKSCSLVMYDARASLTQVKVLSGSETHLVVSIEPKTLAGTVEAQILGGPVAFSNGGNTMTMAVENGTADFRMQSNPGSTGQFQVSWQFKPDKASPNKTVALPGDGWVRFVDEDGRKGRKKIVAQGEGFRQEAKVYDDDGSSVLITDRTGDKRKTKVTDTTTIKDGERVQVVETMEYEKDDKGDWKPKSGKRETKKIVGDKETVKTETWSPTAGWH